MGSCSSSINYNIEELKKKIDEFKDNIKNGNIDLTQILEMLTQAFLFYNQLSRDYKNKVKFINNVYHSKRLEKNKFNSDMFIPVNPPNTGRE